MFQTATHPVSLCVSAPFHIFYPLFPGTQTWEHCQTAWLPGKQTVFLSLSPWNTHLCNAADLAASCYEHLQLLFWAYLTARCWVMPFYFQFLETWKTSKVVIMALCRHLSDRCEPVCDFARHGTVHLYTWACQTSFISQQSQNTQRTKYDTSVENKEPDVTGHDTGVIIEFHWLRF